MLPTNIKYSLFKQVSRSRFALGLLLASAASISFAAMDSSWQSFETAVNGRWMVEYAFPIQQASYSPKPAKTLDLDVDKADWIAGFSLPGGLFDTVVISNMYVVEIQRNRSPIDASITSGEFQKFLASEFLRLETEFASRGASSTVIPGEMQERNIGDKWWICRDLVAATEVPKIWRYECIRPMGEDFMVRVKLIFGHTQVRGSKLYVSGLNKLDEVIATIKLKKITNRP